MRRTLFVHFSTAALAVLLLACCCLFSGLKTGEMIALDALSHLDAPYVLGAAGPSKFDCSGLLVHCFRRQGLPLSHSAEIIGTDDHYRLLMNPSQLVVGDIVCFDTVSDRDPSDHVGVWLGANRFVHASSGGKKVMISELDGYYLERFTGARRYFFPYF